MLPVEDLKKIWPVAWELRGAGGTYYGADVLGIRVSVNRITQEVMTSESSFVLEGSSLRERLAKAYEAAMAQPAPPPLTPEPSVTERLADMLLPLGWQKEGDSLRFQTRLGGLLLRYEARELSLRNVGGGVVVDEVLTPQATDDEIREALAKLFQFPRCP